MAQIVIDVSDNEKAGFKARAKARGMTMTGAITFALISHGLFIEDTGAEEQLARGNS